MNRSLPLILASLGCALALASIIPARGAETSRHAVPREHPYLLGSRDELRALAKQRPAEYQRLVRVAREGKADKYSLTMSVALVAAIEGDPALAEQAHQLAMKLVDGPIRVGHVTFGYDLALCGFALDLCHEAFPEGDRRKLCDYVNKTVSANVNSERSVFHNAWYGYKNWGIGVASYATYHENSQAQRHLRELEDDYRARAVPALQSAGDGGGWAEGYYIHYWLYEWLVFGEVARRCEGVDYYALAPKFYRNRAVAAMFETYPGIDKEYRTRRSIPMGDSGGRTYGGDRDKDLCARRILASYYRDDSDNQTVAAFNETTPRLGGGTSAYMDFLWHDTSVPRGDLAHFRLSHYSAGPGFVYARSSWEDDATYLFFKCGDRFTAHQHLDVGNFLIYKNAELAGDGGHYSEFGGEHDVNYHLRTIAHNTLLVLDPQEKWRPDIRAGKSVANDGGQSHPWRHHNGAATDPEEWVRQKGEFDIADMISVEDKGGYLYAAGDATRAYSSNKLEQFTRQIVFLRPNTVVIFDRVCSTRPELKKTWLLQAMHPPERLDGRLVIKNGQGRLFVQTLLPENPQERLVSGDDLYSMGDRVFPPPRDTGPGPECRVEVSPSRPAKQDYFLHVLTTADAGMESVPKASVKVDDTVVDVAIGAARVQFHSDRVDSHANVTLVQ